MIVTAPVEVGFDLAAGLPFVRGVWASCLDGLVEAYFFRGSEYVRYDIATDTVDPGYPLPIEGNWPGVWGDEITGAALWPNGKVYFFRGWEYMRYDIAADQVDEGYPLPILGNWSGLPGVVLIPL